jgi:subtilisin family serine protease
MRAALPVLVPLLLMLALPVGQAELLGGATATLTDPLAQPLPDADDAGAVLAIPGVTVAAGWGEFLVGYEPGQRDAALLAIQLAGGEVKREHGPLGVALVSTGNATRFSALVAVAPSVDYVETNDATRLHGAQWNGAQWNGAQWNGVEWNGAQWNGAEWNGAEWNARNGAPAGANDPGRALQWGLADVNAPKAWARSTGTRGADLCVLDSGVAWDHKDLAANAWTGAGGVRGYNAIDPSASAYDDAGHGTHVAGIAAAAVNNEFGVAGVGNVRIMPVKVLTAQGTGTESDLAAGLVWCADQDAEVALMALGVDTPSKTLDRALAYAAQKDVLLVASAGNGGCGDCVGYPASDPRVVAVTATDKERKVASFSSRGAQAGLAAPGVDILSTFPEGRFVYGSGTSQAAGFAAGAAALLRDASPGITAAQARTILLGSAKDLGPEGRDPSYGHGLLDVDAALAKAGR